MKPEILNEFKRALTLPKTSRDHAAHLASMALAGEEIDLAELYAHFLPTVSTATPRTRENWLKKVLAGKAETRKYLQYFYSDGERLCATDGTVLNVCGFTADFHYAVGFYDRDLVPFAMEDGIKYPSIDRVIPDETVSATYLLSELEVYPFHGGPTTHPHVAYRIGEGYFSREVLARALQGQDMFTVLNADAAWDRGIKIGGPFAESFSVVMPMRKP